ncbi:MAG TPA: hypothetical protein DDZ53_05205 [Firmicutes bacterium]|nr:hypothetical protein [Bacillota bacterium]
MRKIAAVLFASMLIYGSGVAIQTFRAMPSIDLAQVMADTGATLLEATVDGWCEIKEPINKPEDAGQILVKVLAGMGIQQTGPIQLESMSAAEEFGQITMREAKTEAELPSGIKLLAAVQSTESEGQQDSYLMLNLYDKSSQPNLRAMYELLTKGTATLGERPEHATQLVGVLKGQLTPDRVAELVSQIMRGTEAEMKNIYQNGALVSVSGYSSRLDAETSGPSGIANVNLAMRYNEADNSTWIYLGCPSVWESI